MFGDNIPASIGIGARCVVAVMMDIFRKADGRFVIIHAGREVAKDFETEHDAWAWADANVDDQVLCTPNRLSPTLAYRTATPNLKAQ